MPSLLTTEVKLTYNYTNVGDYGTISEEVGPTLIKTGMREKHWSL